LKKYIYNEILKESFQTFLLQSGLIKPEDLKKFPYLGGALLLQLLNQMWTAIVIEPFLSDLVEALKNEIHILHCQVESLDDLIIKK